MKQQIVGVVLAGGASRRFGSPKAFAKHAGKDFYTYSMAAMKPFVQETIIVTSPLLVERFLGVAKREKVVLDNAVFAGLGPLAGLHQAMREIASPWYMVVPVDVPFMCGGFFKQLIACMADDVDAIVPVVAGKKQVLLALYRSVLKEDMAEFLRMGERSVQQFLKDKRVKYVDLEGEFSLTNVNYVRDYEHHVGECR